MIRKYRVPDCDAIVNIYTAASRLATPFLSDAFIRQECENIRTIWLNQAETWVFETGDVAVGFISLIGHEVGAIFVHPDHQGNGIGRALMDYAASLRNELVLDVFKDNEIGRRFYDRYGFQFEYEHFHEPSGCRQIRLSYADAERD